VTSDAKAAATTALSANRQIFCAISILGCLSWRPLHLDHGLWLHTGLQPKSDNYLPYQGPASKTLSPLVRIYQRLGINGPGCPTTARPGRFSSPEALFVLGACLDISSGRF
jgi:hypothetical protein